MKTVSYKNDKLEAMRKLFEANSISFEEEEVKEAYENLKQLLVLLVEAKLENVNKANSGKGISKMDN